MGNVFKKAATNAWQRRQAQPVAQPAAPAAQPKSNWVQTAFAKTQKLRSGINF